MKKTKIYYWIFTVLLAALMGLGSIPDILSSQDAIALVTGHLGYPAYFLPFIGVAKLLGVIAILVPGYPRIKEWAYAGFVFDITGAIYSSISVGDAASMWAPLFIGYVIIGGSYFFYHKKLKEKAALSVEHAANGQLSY